MLSTVMSIQKMKTEIMNTVDSNLQGLFSAKIVLYVTYSDEHVSQKQVHNKQKSCFRFHSKILHLSVFENATHIKKYHCAVLGVRYALL